MGALGLLAESLLDDGRVIGGDEHVGTFLHDVGEKQEDRMTAFALDLLDFLLEAITVLVEHAEIDDFELADANLLAAHVEVLVVTMDELVHGGTFKGALHFVHFHAESLHVAHAGNLGELLAGLLVVRSAGDGLEDNGIGKDGAQHAAGDVLGDLDAVEIVHIGDDGAGAASGPDPAEERAVGGHITELVMVNDAEHIGGIHALGSLGEVGEVNKVKILAGHVGNNLRSGQAELVENELGFRSGSVQTITELVKKNEKVKNCSWQQ